MEAICSVYELTLDKQDFTESVRAFYKVRTNLKILCLVEEIIEEKHWSQLDVIKIFSILFIFLCKA